MRDPIEEITRFQTKDGWEFKNQEKAEEHIADTIRKFLSLKTEPLITSGWLSKSEQYRIITTIIDNFQDVEELGEIVKNYL